MVNPEKTEAVYDARVLGKSRMLVLGMQHLFAMFGATVLVPAITGLNVSTTLLFAGLGTLLFHLITGRKVPAFLGSSFAFLGSMGAAFAGAVSTAAGFAGLFIGAAFAGLVYVVFALIVKFAGVKWIDKLMPPVIIGPIVAIIGLSLAGNAIGDMTGAGYLGLVCALVTLFTVIISSVYGTKGMKLVPFIIGIGAGGDVDGQVLVLHDMLGMTKGFSPRFLRRYADLNAIINEAVSHYVEDVKSCDFPNANEQY